ncbi:hypothetical protein Pint_12141 [Pistacia integerrima]|uniref:Uncharacterized protein n=1 Tax=Pistacia integerrima TaxID=434235 RepID=A0ACC0XFI4_9ROSI|nr:hypothetical protein Pint_12141 [Pistacia integerrima]
MSLQSMGSGRTESSFSDMSISSGGSGSGFGLSTDVESLSSNSKGMCPLSGMNSMSMLLIFYGLWISLTFILSSTTAPPNGRGMPLGLKDPNRPLPTGQAGDAGGVGLLKGRMQSANESMVPLSRGFESSMEFSLYDYRNSVLEWSKSILLIYNTNSSGSWNLLCLVNSSVQAET